MFISSLVSFVVDTQYTIKLAQKIFADLVGLSRYILNALKTFAYSHVMVAVFVG
jgi:3-methyladenine DNA glycosylase/8-oxoguanine DNA glycosylase